MATHYRTARRAISASDQILVPGGTCWKTAGAERASVVIDAAAYFSAVKAAILQARHTVFLIGWDFDTRIVLEPGAPPSDVPNKLGSFLSHVVRRQPELQVYILRWDLAFLQMPFRGTTPLFLLDWMTSRRLHFRLDRHHPPQACHHQKIVVVDDVVAVCGGIDMTADRWDTPQHRDGDPRRVRPNGEPYGPWHDATMVVQGDVACHLGELARERWFLATGNRIGMCPRLEPVWPEQLDVDFRNIEVAISRTAPEYGTAPPVREIEALYLAAIAAARHTIYIETQYFSSRLIAQALESRLAEDDGPEVVIVNPRRAIGWLEEKTMGSARAMFIERLRKVDKDDRFRFYTPVTEQGRDIYVHAKIMVIDDVLLRVGSSNLNNRSMGLDTECDLAIEVREHDADSTIRKTITGLRNRLVAEHLGVSTDVLAEAINAGQGRIAHAIDALRRDKGRSLRPLDPPPVNASDRIVVEADLLNADRPEGMSASFRKALRALPSRGKTGLVTAAAIVAVGLSLLAIRRSRQS